MAATGRLVVIRQYEPPTPEEAAALLHRVYSRIFDAALLERLALSEVEGLTRPGPESTITPGDDGKGAQDAGSDLCESQ